MDKFLDFWLMLLTQIAGGPGPAENNLVRFALPAIFWAVLLAFAWSRQRHGGHPRERLLAADPSIRFHDTWAAGLLHLMASASLATAMSILVKKRGWLRNIVLLALSFLFLGEFLILLVDEASYGIVCPAMPPHPKESMHDRHIRLHSPNLAVGLHGHPVDRTGGF